MKTALYLIEALQSGDELIFKQVFEEFHPRIYRNILSKTQSKYLAEEVVQLTFIKFWQCREGISEEYALSTQLFRIASTTLIDLLRRQYANEKKLAGKRGLQESDCAYQLNTVEEKDFQLTLCRAMSALPATRRRAFEMSKLYGMSYKEIAAALSISEKAVENHIYKATRRIRELIPSEYVLHLILFLSIFK